jgi:hypothetical protein
MQRLHIYVQHVCCSADAEADKGDLVTQACPVPPSDPEGAEGTGIFQYAVIVRGWVDDVKYLVSVYFHFFAVFISLLVLPSSMFDVVSNMPCRHLHQCWVLG